MGEKGVGFSGVCMEVRGEEENTFLEGSYANGAGDGRG